MIECVLLMSDFHYILNIKSFIFEFLHTVCSPKLCKYIQDFLVPVDHSLLSIYLLARSLGGAYFVVKYF